MSAVSSSSGTPSTRNNTQQQFPHNGTFTIASKSYKCSLSSLSEPWYLSITTKYDNLPNDGQKGPHQGAAGNLENKISTDICYSMAIYRQDATKLRVSSTDYLYRVTKEALFAGVDSKAPQKQKPSATFALFYVSSSDVTSGNSSASSRQQQNGKNVKVRTLQQPQDPRKDILVIKLTVKQMQGDLVYWLPLKPSEVQQPQQPQQDHSTEMTSQNQQLESSVVSSIASPSVERSLQKMLRSDSLSSPVMADSLSEWSRAASQQQQQTSSSNTPGETPCPSQQMNPAQMQKKIFDLESEVLGLRSYITSLRRVDQEQSSIIKQQSEEITSLQRGFGELKSALEELQKRQTSELDRRRMSARVRTEAKNRKMGMLIGKEDPSTASPSLHSSPVSSPSHRSASPLRPQSATSSLSKKRHSPSPSRSGARRLVRTPSKTALQRTPSGRSINSPSRKRPASPHGSPRRSLSRQSSTTSGIIMSPSSGMNRSPVGPPLHSSKSPTQTARSPSDPVGALFDDTVLLQNLHQQRVLSKFSGNRKQKWSLIYRASRDGFGSRQFHRAVDGKGPTLTVIQDSNLGCLFGGFLSKSWHSRGRYIVANGCWLFSLSRPHGDEEPVKIPCVDNKMAAMGHRDKGPFFGDGDLVISNDANINKESYSHLGESYQTNYIHQEIDSKALVRQFFCGSYKFRVDEVEVFAPVCDLVDGDDKTEAS